MDYKLKWILSIVFLTSIPLIAIAEPNDGITPIQEVKPIDLTNEELVDFYADRYGVDKDLAHYIARNESNYNSDAVGDLFPCKNKKSPYYGQDVYARGVYQITRCYHFNVTDEEAFDPVFNIEYAMKLIAQGTETCKQQFTTCRSYHKNTQ